MKMPQAVSVLTTYWHSEPYTYSAELYRHFITPLPTLRWRLRLLHFHFQKKKENSEIVIKTENTAP